MEEENNTQYVTYRITDLSEDERPRERLERLGPEALNTSELLAILLRTGIPGKNAVQLGEYLIQEFDGLLGLHRASFDQVCAAKGIGPAKAAQIKAAIELGRRMQSATADKRTSINSPEDAANLLRYGMNALEQEELHVILLNARNHVLTVEEVYKGSVNSSHVRVGDLFKAATRRNAVAIIVAHNHPSGDPTPSPDDVAVTRAIVQAGKLLEIEVLDHLVIGGGRYVSMKERGLGFG